MKKHRNQHSKQSEHRQDSQKRELVGQAIEALEAGEDIGELDLAQTVKSLFGIIDPHTLMRKSVILGQELIEITLGNSNITPDKKDWRFKDEAWRNNPFYKRIGQSYLVFCQSLTGILNDDTDWRTQERAKFLLDIFTSTLSPTNTLLGNPAAIKKALDTGGKSLLKGLENYLADLRHNGGMPSMVNASPFIKGENIAATPGAVIFRNELLELMQYRPVTSQVRAIPMLLIPPQINKYYFTDLAPGRSMVEFSVSQGIQMFVVSWRNPSKNEGHWNLDTYVGALLEAVDVINSITRSHKVNTIGFCAGGITMSAMLARMASLGDDRINAISYAVTLLDWSVPAMIGILHSEKLIDAAKQRSKLKGLISGQDMGKLFAWFRPNELVWNYWVNNYLMGEQPPSFDILAWNADSTNLPAGLHMQFLDIFLHNHMAKPGAINVMGTPLNLGNIKADAYVTAGINDHLTPWHGCYRTTQLLGGDCTFVLSHAGHIASLVNPPGNPKATYYTGPQPGKNPDEWLDSAHQHQGSWWEHWIDWVSQRAGEEIEAPNALGNKKYPELEAAPGSYIHG